MKRTKNPAKEAEYRKRAADLVAQMTLHEKVSQMLSWAPAIERLGIPAYNWWSEGIHGVGRAGTATVFPQAIGMAAAFDEDMMEQVGNAIGVEARGKYNMCRAHGDRDIFKGLTVWAPNINIFRDPRWGRGHETYGEDPFLTSRLGVRFVEGMQGDDTDSIITSSVAYDFTNDLHKRLLVEGTKVNDAITDSFNALTPTVMKFRFDGETFGIGIFMLLFVCIHAFFMVFFRPDAKKYKGAKEVPLDGYYAPPQQTAPQPQSVVMKQASCEYCGGVYTVGSCNACPHCGAPIQPQDYTVPVHNGTSTASTTDTTSTNTH